MIEDLGAAQGIFSAYGGISYRRDKGEERDMNRLNEIDHIFRQVISINSIDDYWRDVYKIIFYQNAALINAIRKPWKDVEKVE